MGALRDILGYFTRNKFLKEADPEDVLIIGVHTEPDMTGVPAPVPVKDAKLIKIKDLDIKSTPCENVNVGSGAGVFAKQSTDPCVNEFRSLKSINLNLSIEQQGNEIEFDTTAEENKAQNVGSGQGIYKDKTGETLNFRSLTSSDSSISITQSEDGNEIDFKCPSGDVQIPIFFKGMAKDIGKADPVGFNFPRQAIWSDHNIISTGGTGNYGSVFIVPFRMKLESIRIKWRMEFQTSIGGNVRWDIGRLTDATDTGTCDTNVGTRNYTPKLGGAVNAPSFTQLPNLSFIAKLDDNKWPNKVHFFGDTEVIYEEGEMLVLLHEAPQADWGSQGDSDCEIMIKGVYAPSIPSEEPLPEEPAPEDPPPGDPAEPADPAEPVVPEKEEGEAEEEELNAEAAGLESAEG